MTDTCMMIVGFMKSGLLITAPKLGVLTKTLEAIAAAEQGRINIFAAAVWLHWKKMTLPGLHLLVRSTAAVKSLLTVMALL